MQVIPAIDLLDERVVRLVQGKRSAVRVYAENPLALAESLAAQGAEWLHVVDLDAAFGTGNNFNIIARMTAFPRVKIQVGGGIRTERKARKLLEAGVQRVIVGTAAANKKKLEALASAFGKKIWVACDVSKGVIRVNGWLKAAGETAWEVLEKAEELGVGGVIVTDITRDGTTRGVSKKFFKNMREKTALPLVAAGGVSSLGDLRTLAKLGYDGAIVGMALLEKRISLSQAMEVAENAR